MYQVTISPNIMKKYPNIQIFNPFISKSIAYYNEERTSNIQLLIYDNSIFAVCLFLESLFIY